MDEHDGFCARTDEPCDGRAVEVQGVIDVREDRHRPRVHYRVGGGDERERAGDHLVTGADPVSEQGKVESSRSIAGGHSMRGAHRCRESLLESSSPFPLCEHAGAHHLENGGFLLRTELRTRDRNQAFVYTLWRQAPNGEQSRSLHREKTRVFPRRQWVDVARVWDSDSPGAALGHSESCTRALAWCRLRQLRGDFVWAGV